MPSVNQPSVMDGDLSRCVYYSNTFVFRFMEENLLSCPLTPKGKYFFLKICYVYFFVYSQPGGLLTKSLQGMIFKLRNHAKKRVYEVRSGLLNKEFSFEPKSSNIMWPRNQWFSVFISESMDIFWQDWTSLWAYSPSDGHCRSWTSVLTKYINQGNCS